MLGVPSARSFYQPARNVALICFVQASDLSLQVRSVRRAFDLLPEIDFQASDLSLQVHSDRRAFDLSPEVDFRASDLSK